MDETDPEAAMSYSRSGNTTSANDTAAAGNTDLFRNSRALPFQDIVPAWAPEIDVAEDSLAQGMLRAIFDGRLDHAGPLIDGERHGLRWSTCELNAGMIRGDHLRPLARITHGRWRGVEFSYLYLMREAVLAFAEACKLQRPSWWKSSASLDLKASHRAWRLAPWAIDYVARHLGVTQEQACLELQTALLDGQVSARGPLGTAEAVPIPCEFWRFAPPTIEGAAINISSRRSLPWFEVSAADVHQIWSVTEAKPASATVMPASADAEKCVTKPSEVLAPVGAQRAPFDAYKAKALMAGKKHGGDWKVAPTEPESFTFLMLHFKTVPRAQHREIRRELWPGNRPGPRPKRKVAD